MDEDENVLKEIEIVSQEITEGKHYLIELDRRQNQYREARRKLIKSSIDEDVYILCNGSTFVKSEVGTPKTILFFDEKLRNGESEILKAREALKQKVAQLARLEGPNSALAELYQGFDLKGSKSGDFFSEK